MPDNLLREIQDKNIPVSTLLIKAKILANKLNDEKFLEWLNLELNGYKSGNVYPEYRKITGQVKFWNPYHGWCPIVFSNPEAEKYRSSRNPNQSISEIEELLSKGASEYEMPFSDSTASEIMRDSGIPAKVTLLISSTSLVGILNKVRNLLLDWVLKLENNNFKKENSSERQNTFNQDDNTFGIRRNVAEENHRESEQFERNIINQRLNHRDTEIQNEEENIEISQIVKNKYKDIKLEPKNKKGMLQLKKGGKWINLGGYNTRLYKMVKYILMPSSKSKMVDDVFEHIGISKDDKNEELQKETPRAYQIKKKIIEETVAVLQKAEYLKGHIKKPEFDDKNKTVIIKFS